MKTIKDAVHDHIPVDDFALSLLDTPQMQRLRHIRQLGMAYLVYPSANHTRFEHSLGVFHLAEEALDNLGVEDDNRDAVRAAALLHDVGHTPFSHTVEDVIEEYTGKRHDEVRGILEGDVAQVLEERGLDVDRIARLIKGDGRLGQLVSGKLDVDRMDYLVRDAHHTGVPYGTIDNSRLVLQLEFAGDELVLGEGNVQTAEALLIARSLMYPTVYNHHVARISKAMLKRATRRLIESGTSASDVRRMDDHEFLVSLQQEDETCEIGHRLIERRLYKRAVWKPFKSLDIPTDEEKCEREIAREASVEPRRVVLDVSPPPRMDETDARIVVDGEVRKLEEVSRLVSVLRESQREQWRYGVYCPEEDVEDVKKASEKIIG